MDEFKETLSKILDIVGKILAVVLVLSFLLYYLNLHYDFFPAGVAIAFNYIVLYGATLLVAIVAIEGTIQRSIILTIIVIIPIVLVIIFMFFPGVRDSIFNFLPAKRT